MIGAFSFCCSNPKILPLMNADCADLLRVTAGVSLDRQRESWTAAALGCVAMIN
jgi:hypothetical protein